MVEEQQDGFRAPGPQARGWSSGGVAPVPPEGAREQVEQHGGEALAWPVAVEREREEPAPAARRTGGA